MKNEYVNRARLLLDIMPYLSTEKDIAVKGGTAINMFYRDFPRASVDIDLVYLPIAPREETLRKIDSFLRKVSEKICKNRPGTVAVPKKTREGLFCALTIEERGIVVKIEPNTILRGSVFPVEWRGVLPAVADTLGFEGFINIQVLSLEDLYGGKICAALDRQHPRDLFDIMVLFENEGITPGILRAFVVYLAGHDRPMSELLSPQLLDMREVFQKEFAGMTDRTVTWSDLTEAREKLIREINRDLSMIERNFLISMKRGEPQWDLLGNPDIEHLPSLQWKLINIRKMDAFKHRAMLTKLTNILGL